MLERIAAPGTDPALAARVVGRMLGPRGSIRTIARAATERAAHDEFPVGDGILPDRAVVRALLRRLAPPLTRTAAQAVEAVARRWQNLDVRIALAGDRCYPDRLATGWPLNGAPPLLAWRGDHVADDRPTVAIVGARRATPYGTGIAAWIGEVAADSGVRVVSGGAVGIDAAAHGGALDRPGGTAVVLGCGHSVDYPRPHARPGGLFDRVLEAGGALVSEQLPDVEPRPAHVLARNRIVAGLADAVVVVEGGERSGSLRTATIAADLGIPVLAVPGDVRAPLSAAPHRLLSEGAAPCTHPRDVLEIVGEMRMVGGAEGGDDAAKKPAVSTLPPAVLDALTTRWPRPIRIDELARITGMEAAHLLAAATRARLAGEVAESPDGLRLQTAPPDRPADRPGATPATPAT